MTETPALNNTIPTMVLNKVRERLGKSLTSLVFFGSRVNGGYRSSSDFDFLVEYSGSPEDETRVNDVMVDIIVDILFDTKCRTSLIALSKRQVQEEAEAGAPFLGSVMTCYRILYNKEGFTAKALESLKGKLHLVYKEKGKTWDLKRAV